MRLGGQVAVLARSPLEVGARLDLLAIVNDFVTGHALRAAEMEQRPSTRARPRRPWGRSTRLVVGRPSSTIGRMRVWQHPDVSELSLPVVPRALSEPTRLKIVEVLGDGGECSAGSIALQRNGAALGALTHARAGP